MEVAATADRSRTYECFHFQEIKDVLQEDDEIVVRGLSNEELRERRQGGRLQIASDGRHLIDGLSWGRRWRAGVSDGRPDIVIPPRKKRRLMIEPDEDGEVDWQLEYPPSRDLVPLINREHEVDLDDDDDDDEDYEETEDNEEHDSICNEDVEEDGAAQEGSLKPSSPNRITAHVTFEDADLSDEEDISLASDQDLSEGAEDFAAEVEALTSDAGLSKIELNRPRRRRQTRTISEQIRASHPSDPFEGFSSPNKGLRVNGLPKDNADSSEPVMKANEIAQAGGEFSEGKGRSSEIVALAQDLTGKPIATLNEITTGEAEDLSIEQDRQYPSASHTPEASSSGDESDQTSSSEDYESDSSSADDDTSSDESSDSGESTSSSDTSLKSLGSITKPMSAQKLKPSEQESSMDDSKKESKAFPRRNNPPGTGQNKTRRNNERKRLSKLLSNLKEAGKLAKDADFKTLREYLASSNTENGQKEQSQEKDLQESDTLQDRINARAGEILARLQTDTRIVHMDQDADTMDDVAAVRDDKIAKNGPSLTTHGDQSEGCVDEPNANTEAPKTDMTDRERKDSPQGNNRSSPKRAKLDVAASRRMLFSALGVRNPKTSEDEQALRDRFAASTNQVKGREQEAKDTITPTVLSDKNRWKKKFTVLAVECVQEWKKIDPPPFPFKQPWQVRQEKFNLEKNEKQQQKHDPPLNYDEVVDEDLEEDDTQPKDVDHMSKAQNPSQPLTASKTLNTSTAAEEDDLPEILDYENLPTLSKSNLAQAEIIAYKELHINARFEPEQSPYRVARLLSRADNTIMVKLALRYRKPKNVRHDEKTGQRLYNRFEIPDDDDDEPDGGLREIDFDQMIDPKIVKSNVERESHEKTQNTENGAAPTLRGGHLDNPVYDLSPNLGTAIEIATPRRAEINGLIKEAGFDSAVNNISLQGRTNAARQDRSSPSPDHKTNDSDKDGQTNGSPSGYSRPASPLQGDTASTEFRESSVPSESMVESVKYPKLSQFEFDTSIAAQSSSHQDAQMLTPTPALSDEEGVVRNTAFRESEEQIDPEFEVEPDSLPSEVPQTQSQGFVPDSLSEMRGDDVQHSDVGMDLDDRIFQDMIGSIEPEEEDEHNDDDDDDESLDSNGLPSLRSLTSSQRRLKSSQEAIKTKSKTVVDKVKEPSPEPLRRSPRVRRPTARSSDWSDSYGSSHSHSQKAAFKSSQSQRVNLSQVPEDMDVVDLTRSSSAGSPDKRDKDKEMEDDINSSSKGRRKTTSTRRGASAKRDAQVNIFRGPFDGPGERKLSREKKRSA